MRYISEKTDDLEPFEGNSKDIADISENERNILISILKEEFKRKYGFNSIPKEN